MERSVLGCLLLKFKLQLTCVIRQCRHIKQGNSSPGYDEFTCAYMCKIALQMDFTHVTLLSTSAFQLTFFNGISVALLVYNIFFWMYQSQLKRVEMKMQRGKVCLCTNTPGDSKNNAAVPGSHRAARAVRPFVSRGHSLHYNPTDKAPSGGTKGHGGGGIVPHSMHLSLLLRTNRKHTFVR